MMDCISGYGLGASSIALFGRVGMYVCMYVDNGANEVMMMMMMVMIVMIMMAKGMMMMMMMIMKMMIVVMWVTIMMILSRSFTSIFHLK